MPASSAISQSLSSLLPTHANKVPALLTHLAESLLAQSRQRAANLKPEEEIARAYACCEIACNRLRSKCRLPAPKTGGAPCKPAVYKKLVAFLESLLNEDGAVGTPRSTPGGRKRTADGSLKKSIPEREEPTTPSKSTRRTDFLGKIRASSSKKTPAENEGEAPSYTMPSIRKLCKAFSTPLLAPHVYTGTCVVLKLDGLWPPDADNPALTDEALREKVTGLLIALYIMTLTKMQTAEKLATSVYMFVCEKAVELSGYTLERKGVEEWVRRINRQGYGRKQEWFISVPENVFEFDPDAGTVAAVEGDEDEDVPSADDEDEEDQILSSRRRRKITSSGQAVEEEDNPEGVLLPGLHTMMQNAFDYLSEERTREFETWKKQFLQRLNKLDKPPAVKAGKAIPVK